MEGERHGQWVVRWISGDVWQGPFVDGKKHGQWVFRYSNGEGEEGPYVEGKKHGQWVFRFANGGGTEGPYVEGKGTGSGWCAGGTERARKARMWTANGTANGFGALPSMARRIG